ncbi:hypothetical protein KDA_41000 [Dictyobacter alpinus]|uniref:Peptidase S53 domain-containing protein n=1 Tax=Dictyobacter alpinus TaxID=2014873 RepID=A0A402BBC8_9CHLR|nr:S53 family peptidase [Dictyobacter alpinus]GCE28616.1 hypothetical protein KDA_41000 [Dictyobacter alpinus]
MGRMRLLLVSLMCVLLLLAYAGSLPATQIAWADMPPVGTQQFDVEQQFTHAIPMDEEAVPFGEGLPPCLSSQVQPRCYSPQQIRRAYQIEPLLNRGISGQGQTIVIIDFFQSPTVREDLRLFDQLFGLPEPSLTIYTPSGTVPFDSNDRAQRLAAIETNLDVQWAHAIAPGAAIALVLSRTEESDDVYAATKFAIEQHLGTVISQSFGISEAELPADFMQKEHALFVEARAQGISVFASSGDRGTLAPIYGGMPRRLQSFGTGVDFPASDPLVTGVGGTSLFLGPDGSYEGETVWSNLQGAPGGGFSRIFSRPAYQEGFVGTNTMRSVPDVAYVADPTTGVAVVTTIVPGHPMIIPLGGTSAGSPQWAAIAALGNQLAGRPLGFLNPSFYQIGRGPLYKETFHDITSGSNAYTLKTLQLSYTLPGYEAAPGWDPATGLGTPIATPLLLALASRHYPRHPARRMPLITAHKIGSIGCSRFPKLHRVKKQTIHHHHQSRWWLHNHKLQPKKHLSRTP